MADIANINLRSTSNDEARELVVRHGGVDEDEAAEMTRSELFAVIKRLKAEAQGGGEPDAGARKAAAKRRRSEPRKSAAAGQAKKRAKASAGSRRRSTAAISSSPVAAPKPRGRRRSGAAAAAKPRVEAEATRTFEELFQVEKENETPDDALAAAAKKYALRREHGHVNEDGEWEEDEDLRAALAREGFGDAAADGDDDADAGGAGKPPGCGRNERLDAAVDAYIRARERRELVMAAVAELNASGNRRGALEVLRALSANTLVVEGEGEGEGMDEDGSESDYE